MDIQKCYRPLNEKEIQDLKNARQIFCDCYLVSSVNSLCKSNQGKKILKENVQTALFDNYPKYKIRFNNVYGEAKDVFVTSEEVNNLCLKDKYSNPVLHGIPENKTLKAIELATGKIIDKYPFLKSFLNRMPKCSENFEYNNPSRFMKIFTGKEPLKINEGSPFMSLTHHKEEAIEVLKKIEKTNGRNSVVAGTGVTLFPNLQSWHCYVIDSVDTKLGKVRLYNTRSGKPFEISILGFIRQFKFLVGLFPKNFK